MSTAVTGVDFNELAPKPSILVNDLIAMSDSNGLAYSVNTQELQVFLNTIGVVSYQGVLLAADSAVTQDGIYLAGDSGTYTNNGGLVVDINNNFVLISITETQTVFTQVEIPLNIVFDAVPKEGSTKAVESGGVFSKDYITIDVDNDCFNGDFQSGTSGLGYFSLTASIETGDFKVGTQCLKATTTSDGLSSWSKTYNSTAVGDKLFMGFWTKNGTTDNIRDYIYGSVSSTYILGSTRTIPESDWVWVSYYLETEAVESIYLRPQFGTLTGDYRLFDGVTVINLTEAFGAGKEPTKEDMDNLVFDNGNYIGDTTPLKYTQFTESASSTSSENTDVASMVCAVVDLEGDEITMYSKVSKRKTVFWVIKKFGVNDAMQMYSYGWFYSDNGSTPQPPEPYDTVTTIGAGADYIGSVKIALTTGGDSGTEAFTGGNHSIGGVPTSENIGYSVFKNNGIEITTSGTYLCQSLTIDVGLNIKGYNTMDAGTFIMKQLFNYTFYSGTLSVGLNFVPLDTIDVILIYGIQCNVSGGNWDNIKFINGENPATQTLAFNLNSGEKGLYPINHVVVSTTEGDSIRLTIDQNVGLGKKEKVSNTAYPFHTSGQEVYATVFNEQETFAVGDTSLRFKAIYDLK